MADRSEIEEFADVVEPVIVTQTAQRELKDVYAAAVSDMWSAMTKMLQWQADKVGTFSIDEQEEVLRLVARRLGADYNTDERFLTIHRGLNERRFADLADSALNN